MIDVATGLHNFSILSMLHMFAVQSHVELAAFPATKEDSAIIIDPNAKSIFA